jgi:hypothetical protein
MNAENRPKGNGLVGSTFANGGIVPGKSAANKAKNAANAANAAKATAEAKNANNKKRGNAEGMALLKTEGPGIFLGNAYGNKRRKNYIEMAGVVRKPLGFPVKPPGFGAPAGGTPNAPVSANVARLAQEYQNRLTAHVQKNASKMNENTRKSRKAKARKARKSRKSKK